MADQIKVLNVAVTVGDHNYFDGPKINFSVRTNYQECLELFTKTGLNFDNDLVYKIFFNTKSSLDDYTLGENMGFFRNKINWMKTDQSGPRVQNHSMNLDLVRDYTTYQNQVVLTVGLDQTNNMQIINDLTQSATFSNEYGFHDLELSLEINQRLPSTNFDQDEQKLHGKLSGKIEFSEMKLGQQLRKMIKEQPYGPVPFWGFGLLMMNGDVDLHFHQFEQLIDSGMLPWPPEIPRISGFVGLKNFLMPLVGGQMQMIPKQEGDFKPYDFVTELYQKFYETITGISEIKVGFKNYVISIKFSGLDFMNGYFPDLQTLLNSSGAPVGMY